MFFFKKTEIWLRHQTVIQSWEKFQWGKGWYIQTAAAAQVTNLVEWIIFYGGNEKQEPERSEQDFLSIETS